MTMKEAGVGVVFCEMRVGWVLLLVKRFRLLLVLLRLRNFFFETSPQFAKDMGIPKFIVKGDSLNIFQALDE